jgi:hypothetical protein
MFLDRLVAPIFLCVVLALIPSYFFVGQGQTADEDEGAILCNDPRWNGEGTCIIEVE